MVNAKERTAKVIETILIAIICSVLIYRCYKMEVEVFNYKVKHNELANIVQNNAIVLNTVVDEVNQVIDDCYEERGDIVDED